MQGRCTRAALHSMSGWPSLGLLPGPQRHPKRRLCVQVVCCHEQLQRHLWGHLELWDVLAGCVGVPQLHAHKRGGASGQGQQLRDALRLLCGLLLVVYHEVHLHRQRGSSRAGQANTRPCALAGQYPLHCMQRPARCTTARSKKSQACLVVEVLAHRLQHGGGDFGEPNLALLRLDERACGGRAGGAHGSARRCTQQLALQAATWWLALHVSTTNTAGCCC